MKLKHIHNQARKRPLRSSGPAEMVTGEPPVKKREEPTKECRGTIAFHCPNGKYAGPNCSVRKQLLIIRSIKEYIIILFLFYKKNTALQN